MSYPPPPAADDQPTAAPPGYGNAPDHSYDSGAGFAVPAYQQPPYGYAYPPAPRPVNGLAIASLVVSCAAVAGICAYGIGGLLGVVGATLGHVGRRQARRSGEGGEGMALAGIIVGWVCAAVAVLAIAGIVFLFVTTADSSDPTPYRSF